ncbi:MAG: hypothetical protein Q4C96_11070 [Planctomycetia bacterium]|nr:hypothetical protein [Planctomycetia bacterium]
MLSLFTSIQIFDFFYAIPLILGTSFVYAATRQEEMSRIIPGGIRVSLWITGFLAAIFLLMVIIF